MTYPGPGPVPTPSDGSSLTVVRDALQDRGFTAWSGRRMFLYTEDGENSFTFELAPSDIDYSDLGNEWVTTERAGDSPLLQFKGKKLVAMKFSFTMSDRTDYYASQNNALLSLQRIAGSQKRVLVRYSAIESGLWRVEDLSFKSALRHPQTNDPIRVTADITLRRAQDPEPTGIVASNVSPIVPTTTNAPRSYVVKANDTLGTISQAAYGTPLLWQRVWEANRTLVPMPWDVRAGQKLTIP